MIQHLVLLIFPVTMAFAAANDLFTMRIPNKLSLVLIAGFTAAALVAQLPLQTFGLHVAVAAAVLAFTFTLFSFNLFGGGDAKLMAVGALWMGVDQVLPFIAAVTVLGGVLSLMFLFYRKFIPVNAVANVAWAQRLHMQGKGIPYGIAIAAAGLLVYPETEIFKLLSV